MKAIDDPNNPWRNALLNPPSAPGPYEVRRALGGKVLTRTWIAETPNNVGHWQWWGEFAYWRALSKDSQPVPRCSMGGDAYKETGITDRQRFIKLVLREIDTRGPRTAGELIAPARKEMGISPNSVYVYLSQENTSPAGKIRRTESGRYAKRQSSPARREEMASEPPSMGRLKEGEVKRVNLGRSPEEWERIRNSAKRTSWPPSSQEF